MADNNKKQKTAEAHLRRLRIAPRKSRMVTEMVKGMPVGEAQAQLLMTPKKASDHVLKLLKSAMANAKNNHSMDLSKLFISEIRVDEGPTYKRWMPRAYGRATPIHKKTSHIHIKLAEKDGLSSSDYIIPENKKEKPEKPSGKKKGGDDYDDKPMEPKETEKPTDSRSRNPMKRIFRRKSV